MPRRFSPPIRSSPWASTQVLDAFPSLPEYSLEHPGCQLAGIGVLTTGVIGGDDDGRAVISMDASVAERRARLDGDAAASEQLPVRVECNLAQRDDDLDPRERVDFGREMILARGDLVGVRLVVGWRAPDGRRDEGVAKRQAVRGVPRYRDAREAVAVQRAHQEVTGASDAVTGEDAARAIRAVRGGREAENQYPRARIAESRDRLAPISLVSIRGLLLGRDPPAVLAESRAALAGDDLLMNLAQRGWHSPRL